MYITVIAALMLVLPAISMASDVHANQLPLSAALIGKWFVIWSVGVRLGTAGLRQTLQPRYTAQVILSLKSEESLLLVKELGFANLAIGLVGLMSSFAPSWWPAGALGGGVFLGLAGTNHAVRPHRSSRETFAMASDLWVAAVLLACLLSLVAGQY